MIPFSTITQNLIGTVGRVSDALNEIHRWVYFDLAQNSTEKTKSMLTAESSLHLDGMPRACLVGKRLDIKASGHTGKMFME
jgi:hypothetical protein